MVYITGDCHADWHRFSTESFPEQKEMTREDIVIVCGDFGLWHDTKEERWWLDWLANKSFTLVFVDGNHENFDRLYSDEFSVVEFHGGKAHRIRDNIYHLMRGYIFEFCSKSFFAFGGARSHDIQDGVLDRNDFKSDEDFVNKIRVWSKQKKMFRINHVSWWEQELPSREEMDFGLSQLENRGFEVDYIISHCCPQDIAALCGFHETDRLTTYFAAIAQNTKFRKWFFGHYHDDKAVLLNNYIMLYEQIVRIV